MKTLAILAGCAGACALAFAQNNRQPSSAGALSQADVAAIRAASKVYEHAGNARDWRTLLSVFTEDVVWMPPNAPRVSGRKAVEATLENYPRFRELKLEPVDVEGRGDLAYVNGRYSLILTPASQPEQRDAGKYIEIWRKQRDGAWKYAKGIFNSDLPVAGTGPATAGAPAGADEQAIREIEKRWDAALVRADADYIDSITSADWTRTSPDGKLSTKAEMMAAFRSGAIRIDSFQVEELKVRVSGDTAVALGLVTAKGSTDGRRFHRQSRFTDVFVKRDGRWLCIATHGSNVDKTGGDVAAAIKAEIEKHYTSIARGDDGWKAQHTVGMSMFSPEFDGLMLLNSPTWLAALASRGEHILNWRPRGIEVQNFGNTAVATFHMDGSMTRKADGAVDSRPRRVTEVWVNDNGTWKEAHHHDSVYTAPSKPMAAQ